MLNYGHGDDIYDYPVEFKANFSSNVWVHGTPKSLQNFLIKQINKISNYPQPNAQNLTKTIEIHHCLKTGKALVTNGATEAFYLITNVFYGKSVTICTPSFSEYEQASCVNKLSIQYCERKSIINHRFTTDLAFICNPNNPDGFENTTQEIKTILKKFPNTIFVIDEAYVDFTLQPISCVKLIENFDNIIIVKSLTKLFCITGLRLGYVLSNEKQINKLYQYKIPWNVNSLAISCGQYIFKNYQTIKPNIIPILQNKEKLQNRINQIEGFEVLSSRVNYFLIKLKEPVASLLKAYLIEKHQILIRNASNFRSLDEHYIRIAVQTEEKNQLLIKALQLWKF